MLKTHQIVDGLFSRLCPSLDDDLHAYGSERTVLLKRIERLLNHRSTVLGSLGVSQSIIGYGVQDFTHLSSGREQDCLALCERVKTAIDTFEPQLHAVTVHVSHSAQISKRLYLTISGVIRLDQAQQVVCLNADLDVGSRSFVVTEGTV